MTSDEFYANVKSYIKINPSMMFIIWSNPTEAVERQTKARAMWMDYLEAQGLHTTVKVWKAIWNGEGKAVTVPSEDPHIFDLGYSSSQDTPRSSYGARRQEKSASQPRQYRED